LPISDVDYTPRDIVNPDISLKKSLLFFKFYLEYFLTGPVLLMEFIDKFRDSLKNDTRIKKTVKKHASFFGKDDARISSHVLICD